MVKTQKMNRNFEWLYRADVKISKLKYVLKQLWKKYLLNENLLIAYLES